MKENKGEGLSLLGPVFGAGAVLILVACVIAVLAVVCSLSDTPTEPLAKIGKAKTKKVLAKAAPTEAAAAGSATAKVESGAGAGASASSAPKTGGTEQVVVASAEHGESVYNIYCVACHQAEGQGKVGFAPFIRNRDFLTLASDDYLRTTIMSGRPGTAMVPWTVLKPHEVDSLVLYLRSAQDPNAEPIATVDPSRKHPGDAAAGEGLYGQYCAACHGENASGYAEGGPGPAIGNAGFLSVASDDFIFQSVKHGRRGTPMRAFSGSRGLANLSDQEIGDIIAWLRNRGGTAPPVVAAAADPKAGKMHFAANCSPCHQQDGKGLPGVAPSIRNRDFLAIASDDFIKQTVRKGRVGTTMVQRPDLSDQAVEDIIAFLRAVPVGTSVDVQVDPSKDLASLGNKIEGHAKFTIYCASCHGDQGKGFVAGGSGPAVGLPGFLNAASDDYIYQTLKLGRMGTAMRPFLGSKGLANLSDQDAHDIIAYLRSLNPESN